MKEIVIISGKGGTGKTSLTASFAMLEGSKAVIADCDVDAADLHLLLQPDFTNGEDFYSGQLASIDPGKCTNCGKCKVICRFEAIHHNGNTFAVDELDCEGCGYCARICPTQAIKMNPALSGRSYISSIKTGSNLSHAELAIGADNSGKLVTKVKQNAKNIASHQDVAYIIIDGTPGIGCPVTASLTGADYTVIITEPTISGVHDMKRVFGLIENFRIPSGLIINKYDLNPEKTREIESYTREKGIDYLGKIAYNENFTKAMTEGLTLVEYDLQMKKEIAALWSQLKQMIHKKQYT